MINTFLAAIVALFFWKKSSKDLEEKTQLASWTRTIIFGVLAFAILVFYLKTYQVTSIYHGIQLSGVVETVDSTGNIVDSVATVDIYNKFSSGITENFESRKFLDNNEELKKISELGGIFVAQDVFNREKTYKKINKKYKQEFQQHFRRILENDNGYLLGNQPVTNYSHAYQFFYTTSGVPSLIPLFIKYNKDKEDTIPNFSTYSRIIISDYDSYEGGKERKGGAVDGLGNVHELIEEENKEHEMYIFAEVMTDTITTLDEYQYNYFCEDNVTNRMNFFTAADISQYVINLDIKTECNIKILSFHYDIPIEINPYDSDMEISSCSFSLKGDYLNENIVNSGVNRFHVKLPTLANLQLIRSLILTTLLTALFSLFLMNFFYRIRKHFISFRDNHITEISKEKVEIFRKKMGAILYLVLFVVCYIIWRIFKDKPFKISIVEADFIYSYYYYILGGLFVLLSIVVYRMFRKAYTIKKKKKK